MTESNIENEHNRAKEYAKERGYILNPDERHLETVLRGLARNEERFGAAYCPCIYHEQEIEDQGFCHCRLFFKKKSE